MAHTYDDEQIAMNGVYPPTPEKETPTTKTVEEVVEEFTKKTDPDNYEVGEYHYLKDNGESLLDTSWYPESPYELDGDKIVDWLRTTLTAQNQAADERLRLILPRVQKFIDKVESGRARSKETYEDMLFIRDLIAKHGITNL